MYISFRFVCTEPVLFIRSLEILSVIYVCTSFSILKRELQMLIVIVPDSIQNVSTAHILDTFKRFKKMSATDLILSF